MGRDRQYRSRRRTYPPTMHPRFRSAMLAVVVAALLVGCGGGPSVPPAGSDVASQPPGSPEPPASAPTADPGWETGPSMPTTRLDQGAAAIDDVIYVAGGLDETSASLTTFEALDTRTGTWSTLPPLPEPRDHFGFAALDGRLYLSGGEVYSAGEVRQGLWVFDPAAGRW